MIARLTGLMVECSGNRAVIDVQGVGYAVFAPTRALGLWRDGTATVHVYTHVREDTIALYGFADVNDRQAFERLLAVNGIGPKLALAALDAMSAEALSRAVEAEDVVSLSRIPGIGKKTAQKLVLDLKGKLPVLMAPEPAPQRPTDLLPLALARLGYTKSDIDRAQAGLKHLGIDVESDVSERLRAALNVLSGS